MITRQRNGVGRLANGYHGTTPQQAEQILTDGFKLNRNPHHWLGYGVYFFQDAPKLAFCWASTRWSQSEVCVLRATIDLSHCLDLFDYKGKRQYEAEYQRFFDASGRDMFQRLGQTSVGHRYVDCIVFNLLCTRLEEEGHLVTVVRCPFDDGPPVWEDAKGELVAAGPSVNGHVQLAVRELSAISKLEVIEDVSA
jgi:hypothetical protein